MKTLLEQKEQLIAAQELLYSVEELIANYGDEYVFYFIGGCLMFDSVAFREDGVYIYAKDDDGDYELSSGKVSWEDIDNLKEIIAKEKLSVELAKQNILKSQEKEREEKERAEYERLHEKFGAK